MLTRKFVDRKKIKAIEVTKRSNVNSTNVLGHIKLILWMTDSQQKEMEQAIFFLNFDSPQKFDFTPTAHLFKFVEIPPPHPGPPPTWNNEIRRGYRKTFASTPPTFLFKCFFTPRLPPDKKNQIGLDPPAWPSPPV